MTCKNGTRGGAADTGGHWSMELGQLGFDRPTRQSASGRAAWRPGLWTAGLAEARGVGGADFDASGGGARRRFEIGGVRIQNIENKILLWLLKT